jgi:hypothetical protein
MYARARGMAQNYLKPTIRSAVPVVALRCLRFLQKAAWMGHVFVMKQNLFGVRGVDHVSANRTTVRQCVDGV